MDQSVPLYGRRDRSLSSSARERYRQLISDFRHNNISSSQTPLVNHSCTSAAHQRRTFRRRRTVAAAVVEREPLSNHQSLQQPNLHSSIPGKDELLELHPHAPNDLGQLPQEDAEDRDKRYKLFFDRLDADNTGHISRDNLHTEMERIQVQDDELHATRILDEMGVHQDKAQWSEFQVWCSEKERLLRQVFDAIDHEQDGQLEPHEIRAALIQLNLEANDEAVSRLLQVMDTDESGHISWHTWREHMMLAPTAHVQDVFEYWTLLAETGDASIAPVPDGGSFWRSFAAGGIAGAVSRTCTAPLDRLKLLMHVTAGKKQFTMREGFLHMRQHGGFASMWRGNGVNVLKITPESAIRFFVWDKAKSLIYSSDDPAQVAFFERLAAGSIAGVTAQVSIFPLEVVKTRLATCHTGVYKGIFHCVSSLYKEGGLRMFYRGLQPAIVGVVPYAGIDLAVYDALRSTYQKHYDESHPIATLVFGVVSSTCGQLISYPFALVRTRLQADSKNQNGMLAELRAVYRMGGVRALYRGWGANLLKAAPAVSISYLIFENTIAFFNKFGGSQSPS
eukprot:TRINITY_DN7166_c0_g1_i1.p1 TRINITY_DN7166_c0_g1~~TRINITY_DN7166_c0_g1_i1.p1  ORF type:complete len:563 (+),score=85.81 TRINITY_DN7166_c0_g1_i1:208-1896(+)